MISYIKGEITDRGDGYVVVDNGGMGFEIAISATTLAEIGQKMYVQLYTYLNVREDGISLFGFYSKEEKNMFLRLITISGLGPKGALSILSGIELNKLMVAIINKDVKTLSKVKGIGKKTAERIILELKESLDATVADAILEEGMPLPLESEVLDQDSQDAVYALRGLGFTQAEATKAVNVARPNSADLQDLIAKALRSLS